MEVPQQGTGQADQAQGHQGPMVDFVYLKNNEEASFKVSWDDTLAQVWDKAYEELKEKRLPKDELECQSGTVLTPYLALTMRQLQEKHVCPNRKFQIKSETGGA